MIRSLFPPSVVDYVGNLDLKDPSELNDRGISVISDIAALLIHDTIETGRKDFNGFYLAYVKGLFSLHHEESYDALASAIRSLRIPVKHKRRA